jgi:WD40 repeat protein
MFHITSIVLFPVLVLLGPSTATPPRTDRYGDPLPDGAIARLGTTRFHGGYGTSLTFSPDGKILGLAGGRQALFFAMPDGKRVEIIAAGKRRIDDLAYAPDGTTLVTVGEHKIGVWDSKTGRLLREFRGHGVQPTFSPDGKLLATRSAVRGGDGAVHLFDLSTGGERFRLLWHEGGVHALAFTADSRRLISGGEDKTIRFWDIDTGKELTKLVNGSRRSRGATLAVARDGKTLATNGDNGIRIWDLATGKVSKEIAGFAPERLAFAPNGKIAASAAYRNLALWDMASGKEIRRVPVKNNMSWSSFVFSPDSKTLAALRGSEVRLWKVATGEELPRPPAHEKDVLSVTFDPSGKTVLSGGWDGDIRLWDAASGAPLKALTEHKGYVRSAVFSPDGRSIISGAGDNSIRVWDVATGKETRRILLDVKAGEAKGYWGRQVLAMGMAPDGKTLVAQSVGFGGPGENSHFQAWNLASGKQLWTKEEGAHLRASFAPDGRAYVCLNREEVQINELPGGRALAVCRTADSVGFSFAFSRDGTMLAGTTYKVQQKSGSRSTSDERLQIWELASGTPLLSIPLGRSKYSNAFVFAPDDRTVAVASVDDCFRLFNVADGKELCCVAAHESRAECLAFSPDGKRLVTGHTDGTIYVWDLHGAPGRAGSPARHLTEDELRASWTALTDADAGNAHQAIWKLIAAAEQALELFRGRLRPAPKPDQQRLRKLLTDLDSDQYKVREAASRELAKMGELAEPALQRLRDTQPAGEVLRRIDKLLAVPVPPATGECLRRLRAVRVLEQIGTAGARALLVDLAGGAEGARETQAARSALTRLQGRQAP